MPIFDDPTIIDSQRRGLPGVAAGTPPQLLDGAGTPAENPTIVAGAPAGSWYLDTVTGILYQLGGATPEAGGELTAARLLQIESDLVSLDDQVTGHALTSHPDVLIDTFIDEGFVLSFDPNGGGPGEERWVPRAPAGQSINVRDALSGGASGDAGALYLPASTFLLEFAGDLATINLKYAGTGTATTAARSDHTHTAEVGDILTGVATGVLSSGTRSLSSATTLPLASGITYDLEATAIVRCRNNVNSGTANLLVRIGTDGSYPQRSRNVQTVGGVPVDQIIHFRGVFTGAGIGMPISWQIQYSAGDAVDVRDWELIYSFRPRR